MGSVEVATGPSGEIVALKRLLDGIAKDKRHVEAFLREARLAALLTHPNVVRAQWAGEEEGELLLAMDYVEGETLKDVLAKTGALPPKIAAFIVACVCEGLHAAHELKDVGGKPLQLVHRDVSPHNVMLGYDGRVLVLDFGVAKIDAQALTTTGEVKGKAAYMSPEQGLGDPVDRRSDLYAVGAILFECIAGRRMWLGDTDMAVLKQLALDEPPKLPEGAPDELRDLVARLVSRDRDARPKSALEVAEALRAFAGETTARDVAEILETHFGDRRREKKDQLARAQRGEDTGAATPVTQEPTKTEVRARSRWPLAFGLFLLALVPTYFFLRPKDPIPQTTTTAAPPTTSVAPEPSIAPVVSMTPSAPVTTSVKVPSIRASVRPSASISASAVSSKPPIDVDPHPF